MIQQWYVARSRADGQYLVARLRPEGLGRDDESSAPTPPVPYLLIFTEHVDVLSYLNRHAPDLAAQFAVESITQPQLPKILQRWSYTGVAIVEDCWLPRIKFATLD